MITMSELFGSWDEIEVSIGKQIAQIFFGILSIKYTYTDCFAVADFTDFADFRGKSTKSTEIFI